LWKFIRITARAAVIEPLRKIGWIRIRPLTGAQVQPPPRPAPLNLEAGEQVRVKSRADIVATLTPGRTNRGLWFDTDEMFPFCGRTFRVRQRISRFIDDRTGNMVELKSDCVTLDGAVCSGENSTARWFCPREIYPYWREAWLERVPQPSTRADVTPDNQFS